MNNKKGSSLANASNESSQTRPNMNNKKGLSLVEVVVSAGAFVVFAMLIQSILLLAHSFQLSQRNLLDTFQVNQMIKQKVCIANSFFKNRNIKKNSSWTKVTVEPTESGGDNLENFVQDPITTKYETLTSSSADNSKASSSQAILQLRLGDGPNDFENVFQDSHTLVVVNSDSQSLQTKPEDNESAYFLSGYIFASRCVPVKKDSIKKTKHGQKATFDSTNLADSAKQILDPNHPKYYKYRPYYFPKSSQQVKEESVLCCEKGEDPDTCKSAIKAYTPRIYVIHFNRSQEKMAPDSSTPSTPADPATLPAFAGEVSVIQELPEWQDIDNIWGTGFMLSINLKQTFSVSNFNLDIMILKNTCATSLGHIKNCTPLSPAIDPTEQKLIGLEGSQLNMGQFITAEVSSCSGYSSGIDTTSAIVF